MTIWQETWGTIQWEYAKPEQIRQQVMDLLSHEVPVNLQNKNGETPLLLATKLQYNQVAQDLLKAGANVNIPDRWKYTPLMYAVQNHDYEMSQKLIKAGADVTAQNIFGETPLYLETHPDIHKMIWGQKRPNMFNGTWSFMGWEGNTDQQMSKSFKEMIDDNCNLFQKDIHLYTPLMYAAYYGYTETAKTLIQHNLPVDAQNRHGVTALMYAVQRDHSEIVEALLKRNAKTTIRNKYFMVALNYAQTPEMKQLLNEASKITHHRHYTPQSSAQHSIS